MVSFVTSKRSIVCECFPFKRMLKYRDARMMLNDDNTTQFILKTGVNLINFNIASDILKYLCAIHHRYH